MSFCTVLGGSDSKQRMENGIEPFRNQPAYVKYEGSGEQKSMETMHSRYEPQISKPTNAQESCLRQTSLIPRTLIYCIEDSCKDFL
mmetsp:Transcript_15516/g.27959  ORF Transcript_15516/g.27959 Transcript_15516/m.27959 type:complete len:86 (-) Transcript_15516:18-275(-)